MSDNLITPVGAGSVLATDDVAGVQYPRVKISFGADGAATDVNTGTGLPVAVTFPTTQAVTQSGVWNVTNITGTISLPTGAASETTLAAASAKLPATLGPKTGAASLSVVPPSDGFAVNTDIGTSKNMFTITPSDATAISPIPRQVRVNVAGTIVLRTVNGAADVTLTVAAGERIEGQIQFIRATGTTAQGFVGYA